METTRLCPECHAPLPADAPAGLCPRCLLQQGALRDSASAPTEPPRRHKGPPSAPALAAVAARFPQFEVRKLIGVGGMGAVYEVRQPQLDRIVALKVMLPEVADDPKFAERFTREARALAKLNHPNIVAVYDFGQAGDWFYFVMEFVDGANLRQTMRAGRLTAAQALAIVPKLCDALQFAHDEGIMHRDIKPENILLDKKGRVKIADFGLAKLLGAEPDDPSITVTGVGMGTPRYMAPEQLENAKAVDHRADIYSLGVVFYEMLTGELPLGRFATPSEKVQIDVRLDEIVLRSLERDVARRYQQVSEVKTAVENVTGAHPAQTLAGAAPVPAAIHPADDFLLCNPRLPRMAQAITVFALLGAPMLFLLDFFLMEELPKNTYAAFVAVVQNFIASVGGLVGTAILFVGGLKLRQLQPSGPKLLQAGLWFQFALILIVIPLAIWIEVLKGELTGEPYTMPIGEALFVTAGIAVLALEITALVWLRRNRQRLAEICRPSASALPASEPPRFSRGAILGAVWAGFGLFAGIPAMLFTTVDRIQSGTASPADLVQTPPPFWLTILLVVAACAPIGTTILGAVAIGNIKRSGGKLYGLPLAFADAVFFPLVLLGCLVVFATMRVLSGFVSPGNAGFGPLIPVLVALVICFFAGRAAWRKIAGVETPASTRPFAGSTGHLVLNVLLSVFTLWFVLEFGFPVAQMITGPDLRLLEVGRQWHLGTTVDSIFSKLAALIALLAAANYFTWRSFTKANAGSKRPAAATEIKPGNEHIVATPSPRPLLSTALVLLCLFGFFFGFSFQAKHSAGATGQTKLITIGALDPLFVSQSGPAGFSTNLNFFSWSFFAVVVSGVAFGALWRIGREDQGKVPRDPGWWRDWWKQVGVWGGLLLIVCVVRTAMHPEKVLQPPGDRTVAASFAKLFSSGPEIRLDRSQLPATATPGRRDFAFTFNAPSNHVLNVWLEFWKDGKVKSVPEFAWGYAPVRGDAIRAGLLLTTQDGDMAGVGSAGQMRFDWALTTNVRGEGLRSTGNASYGHWRTNVFKEIAARGSSTSQLSWDVASAPAAWRPKPGEVATVLAWTAHAGKSVSSTDLNWTEESLRQGVPAVAILLRVRFDPVSPEQLRDSPTTSTSIINVKDLAPVPKPPASPPQTNAPQATTTAPPAALASDLRFSIQQDRSQLPATATPGRQDYAFKFSGPKDHTLNVWMEVWQEGKMEWVSDFDFEAKPKAGEPLAASLKLATMDGDKASVESKGKTRFDWTMLCGGTNGAGSTSGAWRTNILKPMGATYSTWDRPAKTLNPRPGETVTVLGITGYELSNFRSVMPGHTEADLLKRWPNAAVLIRARFSPARPGQLNEGVALSVNVSDKAGERRTFAQFEISKQLGVDLSDCRTPVEAHAALVAAASTPDGRARAAQMIDEFGSDNISYADQFRFAAEPMSAMWWKLRKKEPTTAQEVVGLLENFITAVTGPGSHGVRWNHGEPITKWAEGPLLKDDFAKKLKLTKLQIDEVNKLFKKYADEANALRRRHTKVTKNDQGHVLINIEPYSEECLELARKMVAELGGIVTQDIVPAVKVGALPMAIFGNAGECRETVVLKKDSDGVYVIRIITSDWVPAIQWRGGSTTGWGSKDIDFAFGSYKMYWSEE